MLLLGYSCLTTPLYFSLSLQQDIRLKNAGSWSSLVMNSSTSGSAVRKTSAMECFEVFRKQAKEKEERVSQL